MNCQKKKFRLQSKITYLNCAYMSPLMKKVENAGKKAVSAKSKPYKISVDDFFDPPVRARKLFAQIVNSDNPDRSAIIPSVSYGMSNAIQNLPRKKGNVIITQGQFPSNVYPWMASSLKIKEIKAPSGKNRGKIWNEKILSAIDENTAAVAIGHVHWADGTRFELEAIREKTKHYNAALIIDGTQSVGALPFDVGRFQPDALICAGYKWLFGPYSIGMAYYGEMFDNGNPIENNWINRVASDDFSRLVDYTNEIRPGASRYQVGEHSNFILLPMMIKAMDQIRKWGPGNIQEYCKELVTQPLEELKEAGFLIEDPEYRSSHLFGIRIPGHANSEKVKKQLEVNRISVSFRDDAIRVSPNVYNQQKDLNKLKKALIEALKSS